MISTVVLGGGNIRAIAQSWRRNWEQVIPYDRSASQPAVPCRLQPATGVIFTRMAAGASVDWHNAPRRQYVITLAGGVEIGLGDGSLHRFGPGEGILAEDLTGKGHTTRAVGDGPRVMMIIPLKD